MANLRFLPCLDTEERAARCRTDLDISRTEARSLGVSAVRFSEDGYYVNPKGRLVDLYPATEQPRESPRSIRPADPLPEAPVGAASETVVQVANETTMVAGQRLVEEGGRPLALNFANGIHPGGGFLHGARAQEEVLCRSSVLYLTLRGDRMYDAHRERPEPDSTAWCIVSPDVAFFRTDDGTPLEAPWRMSVITCAAPVAQRVGQPRSAELLAARIDRVLAVSAALGYTELVLGAWGCGAFGNDPHRTARDFRAALEGPFAGRFERVVFAIADWSRDRRYLGPFRDVLR